MKVLTLHQPWASLVALGIKTIETRSWSTKYRGPLAIHAAGRSPDRRLVVGQWTVTGSDGLSCWWIQDQSDREEPLYLGAIVATCTLVDVVPIVGYAQSLSWSVEAAETGQRTCRKYVVDTGSEFDHPHLGSLRLLDEFTTHSGYGTHVTDLEDQKPYGDFTPGRFAWLLADIKPVDPPVPFKGGQGLTRTWEP